MPLSLRAQRIRQPSQFLLDCVLSARQRGRRSQYDRRFTVLIVHEDRGCAHTCRSGVSVEFDYLYAVSHGCLEGLARKLLKLI